MSKYYFQKENNGIFNTFKHAYQNIQKAESNTDRSRWYSNLEIRNNSSNKDLLPCIRTCIRERLRTKNQSDEFGEKEIEMCLRRICEEGGERG